MGFVLFEKVGKKHLSLAFCCIYSQISNSYLIPLRSFIFAFSFVARLNKLF